MTLLRMGQLRSHVYAGPIEEQGLGFYDLSIRPLRKMDVDPVSSRTYGVNLKVDVGNKTC